MSLRFIAPLFSFGIASLLTGCSLQTTSAPSIDTTVIPGTAISGKVYGGSQPVVDAKVYLLAVNPLGYGGPSIVPAASNASVSLLNPTTTGNATDTIGSYVLTNSTGGFDLAGDYSCSTGYSQGTTTSQTPYSANQAAGTEQVYVYILGGDTGSGTNSNAGLLAALGPCNSPTLKITINEATTLATAYAFAGFASDATHIGSSGSTLAITNLNNAFANVANLASTSTGSPAVTPVAGNGTVPTANITAIANILASCISSATASSNCSTLFQYTASNGATGTAPTDTATAAINLAHNPWPSAAGMSALFGLVAASGAPFGGSTLPAQPTDFTLALSFTGNGLSTPTHIAIDATGNVWATNLNGSSVSKFSNAGVALTGASGGGLNGGNGIAVDLSGNIWVTNLYANSLSEFSTSGTPASSTAYTGGLTAPFGIAIDAFGSVWIANEGSDSVSRFSGGTSIYNSAQTTGTLLQPNNVAIDTFGDVWVASTGNGTLIELSGSGAYLRSTGDFVGGLNKPYFVAIDPSNNVWASNYYGFSLSEFSNTAVADSPSAGYTGGGLRAPFSFAIDALGSIWVGDASTNALSEISNSGTPLSPSTGYTGGQLNDPYSVAIDGSGNVWIANYNGGLTEFIGAATPVVTPIVANLVTPYGMAGVNRP